MARPLRRPVADGRYHVRGQGVERQMIFGGPQDREHFLELLAVLPARDRVRVHACGLMDNHYRAVLQTPEAALSAAMQWFYGNLSGFAAPRKF